MNSAKTIWADELCIYDSCTPSLKGGTWEIRLTQELVEDGALLAGEPIGARQEFVVSAPQFGLEPDLIVGRYPPPGSVGAWSGTLPHIVLKDPTLPWARPLSGRSDPRTPWLALMVFKDPELKGDDGGQDATRAITSTVRDFMHAGSTTLVPRLEVSPESSLDDPCTYIKIPVELFLKIAPRLDELKFLAHCRQSGVEDKPAVNLPRDGLTAVLLAGRLPAVSERDGEKPVKHIVHLVSLEGMEPYLPGEADIGSFQDVALLSLASWCFYTTPGTPGDFKSLMLNVAAAAYEHGKAKPENFSLHLPELKVEGDGDEAAADVNRRLQAGYVPLCYHARTGEESFAWYRGPLAPFQQKPLLKTAPFFTADAAMIYDQTNGIFDLSLAAAWEAGRTAALSDPSFGRHLLVLRAAGQRFVDTLQNRLRSSYFGERNVEDFHKENTMSVQFGTLLDGRLFEEIGRPPVPGQAGTALQRAVYGTDPVQEMRECMDDPEVRERVYAAVQGELEPVARWLGKLLLLYPVPFDYLVADERLLPVESLRFFYLDMDWLDALVDGAMSIGLESSRQTAFSGMIKKVAQDAALRSLCALRGGACGTASSGAAPPGPMCGFLLRSAVAAGWPNMVVRPYDGAGNALRILRLDHLSPNVLFCVFETVPHRIEFGEPQDGSGFGVREDGTVTLRQAVPGYDNGGRSIGTRIGSFPLLSGPGCMRDGRVLNLLPGSPDGLLGRMAAAMGKDTLPGGVLTPGALSMQLGKPPETMVFHCPQQ
ncbi:hypothetical protein [Methanoculleus sp.]|uniref:hypothetical protein n=1 Tax=Methanoculleus sp. TaxID=90427 RepID=UPI001BD1FD98|nr:hypothetical protein [Methanoculleus sp.]MDK2989414.1 hypothetical protein [Methanoculleus sp.]